MIRLFLIKYKILFSFYNNKILFCIFYFLYKINLLPASIFLNFLMKTYLNMIEIMLIMAQINGPDDAICKNN